MELIFALLLVTIILWSLIRTFVTSTTSVAEANLTQWELDQQYNVAKKRKKLDAKVDTLVGEGEIIKVNDLRKKLGAI